MDVCNPLVPSSFLSSTFKKHKNIKCHVYGQHIHEVEHASFTQVVLSATGRFADEASVFYKHLACLLSTKWGDQYSLVLEWVCFLQLFSLLFSAI